jgi:phosphoesterase RecJ-like protein
MKQNWQDAYDAVKQASRILVIQAENPDADSLGSALALEEMLGDFGKKVALFCAVEVPKYLRYTHGWDRVTDIFPSQFDLWIIVDTSSRTLLDKTFGDPAVRARLEKTPGIIFDHHGEVSEETSLPTELPQAVYINEPDSVATAELLTLWAEAAKLSINQVAAEHLVIAILGDSLGLMTEATTSRTVRTVADLMDRGAKLHEIDDRRREFGKKSPEILTYKGRLLQRVEYLLNDQLALVHIPWEEIEQYSDQYNPAILVTEEMRQVSGVKVIIALKTYPDGKITGKIRTNPGSPVGDKIAAHFGGGGHPYAAGFKVYDDNYDGIKHELINLVEEILHGQHQ